MKCFYSVAVVLYVWLQLKRRVLVACDQVSSARHVELLACELDAVKSHTAMYNVNISAVSGLWQTRTDGRTDTQPHLTSQSARQGTANRGRSGRSVPRRSVRRFVLVALKTVHTGNKVEFNMDDFVESRLLPKSATNRQRSTLLPIRSTSSSVCTGLKAPSSVAWKRVFLPTYQLNFFPTAITGFYVVFWSCKVFLK